MAGELLQQQLRELHRLLLVEREAAQRLDMEELHAVVEQKSALLASLPEFDPEDADSELQDLAQTIRRENRRNAYLFWSSLNWVRETFSFYNQQLTRPSYSQQGTSVSTPAGAMLLSGKI